MIHVDLIPHDVKGIASHVAAFTDNMRKVLESGTSLAIEASIDALIPSAASSVEADRQALISICATAYDTCQKIASADFTGVEARLQRLGADITSILHGKAHGVSSYIQWFEVVFNHLFGKQKVQS